MSSPPDSPVELSDSLRALTEAARHDGPSTEQLARLAARLGPRLAPPTPPTPPAPSAPPVPPIPQAAPAPTLSARTVLTGTAVGLAGLGVLWLATAHAPEAPRPVTAASVAPSAPVAVPTAITSEPAPSVSSSPIASGPATSSIAPTPPQATATVATASAAPRTPADELALIGRAQQALGSSPATALSLAAQHAQFFPRGAFTQEREVITIQALARLGRTAEAASLARQFRQRYPRSAYLPRLDTIVPAPRSSRP